MSSTPQEGTYATGHDAPDPVVPGLVDPSWTRLAAASLAPVLLAASASLPSRARLVLVLVLVPLMAQGWSALVRARHDWGTAVVVGLTGVAAAVAVTLREDYGAAAVVMAFSVLLAFVGQMLRKDGRPDLVEDLSATVTGNLVVVSGAAWCALGTSGAHPAVTVPCALALVTGALLTVLEVRAGVLETLTMTLPALVAGLVGGLLAAVGFFGPGHTGLTEALQSAAACRQVRFMPGVMIAVANRVLWAYRWVPGGRAAVASALVPVLAAGAPVYTVARLMGRFVAG